MSDTKKESLRRVLFKEHHPIEKWMRVAFGPLTLEGIPRGKYRMAKEAEVAALRRAAGAVRRDRHHAQRTDA
jgi:16S rRNA U516 pseudouridylate synthase RsuA-like enzyme